MQISVYFIAPPTFDSCPLISFALAAALPVTVCKEDLVAILEHLAV